MSQKSFDKTKPENSKIIFDDEGNQQNPIKKVYVLCFERLSREATRWRSSVQTVPTTSNYSSQASSVDTFN